MRRIPILLIILVGFVLPTHGAMRTFTTAGVNNLWSNAANWDTAPGDGDGFTIPLGQTCEFDADLTAWAGCAASVITGTFQASDTAGSYVLKMAGAITGTGTLRAGTSTAVPYTQTFTIILSGADTRLGLTGTSSYQLYCQEPTTKWVRCTQVEAIGATVLEVDTDITADRWADGDTITISDLGARECEVRTIAAGGRAAGSITITAGLTAAKQIGAYIAVMTRNIRITASGTVTSAVYVAGGYVGAAISGTFTTGFESPATLSIGGTVSGCAYGISTGYDITTTAVYSNNSSTGVNASQGLIFQPTAALLGCNSAIYRGSIGTLDGVLIAGCANGIHSSSVRLLNSSVIGNTFGIRQADAAIYKTTFASNGTDMVTPVGRMLVQSWEQGGTAGDYRSWAAGGYTATDLVVFPTGFTWSIKATFTSASAYARAEESDILPANRTWSKTGWIKQSTASLTYQSRVQIIDPASDPLSNDSAVVLAEYVCPADTDWHQFDLTPAVTTTDKAVIVRFIGGNASGNAWAVWSPPGVTSILGVTR